MHAIGRNATMGAITAIRGGTRGRLMRGGVQMGRIHALKRSSRIMNHAGRSGRTVGSRISRNGIRQATGSADLIMGMKPAGAFGGQLKYGPPGAGFTSGRTQMFGSLLGLGARMTGIFGSGFRKGYGRGIKGAAVDAMRGSRGTRSATDVMGMPLRTAGRYPGVMVGSTGGGTTVGQARGLSSRAREQAIWGVAGDSPAMRALEGKVGFGGRMSAMGEGLMEGHSMAWQNSRLYRSGIYGAAGAGAVKGSFNFFEPGDQGGPF